MAYSSNFSTALISLVNDLVSAEKVTLSEMLFEKSFGQNGIADQHEVVTGVRHGQVVPILKDTPNPEAFPFVDETSCVTTDSEVSHEFSSMTWQLKLIESRVGICMRSFDENFLRFFNAWRQTQEGEPNLDSALLAFINGKFSKDHVLADWRAAYFADTSSTSAYFNGFDGLFVQAEAKPENVLAITQNTVDPTTGTFTEQNALTGEQVYNYLIEMYDQAALKPWFDPSIMEYRVTRSMSQRLVSYLNKLGKHAPENCACIDPQRAVARNVFMLDGLTINGIPVLTHTEWDNIINYSTELNGGGGDAPRVQPHRALLSVRQNVLIGTSQTDALQSFDIWYSKDDKKVYLEGSSYIGSALPLDEYVLAI